MNSKPLSVQDRNKENSLLSIITLITNLGDFITLFAIFKITYLLTDSALIAGYGVALQSLGTVIAGLTLPSAVCRISTRSLILLTQGISFFVMLVLLALYVTERLQTAWVFLGALFLITTLNEIFKASRETHSKGLDVKDDEHRTLQAQLVGSFYGAQFVGPIVAFFLLLLFPIWVSLAIDVLTFGLAFVIALRLHKGPVFHQATHVFKPLRYLFHKPVLRRIFLIRAVYCWIPLGIFNIMLFPMITQQLNLGIEYSAWVYSIIGLGATLAAILLRSPESEARHWIGRLDDRRVTALGLFVMAGVIALVALNLGVVASGLIMFTFGAAMSLNAIGTQSMRRKVSTQSEFPEIVGFELIVSRAVEWIVVTFLVAYLSETNYSVASSFVVAGLGFLALGVYTLRLRNEDLKSS